MNLKDVFDLRRSVPSASPSQSEILAHESKSVRTEIMRRVQWLSHDCSTVWRIRLEQTEWYEQNKSTEIHPSGLGGGNFMMAHTMLSALNFLSKAHRHLTKPEAFVTDANRTAVEDAKKKIKAQVPELKALFKDDATNWIASPKGSCNETSAFRGLVRSLAESGIEIGIPVSEAETVWKQFRNNLAHMAQPEGWVEVCGAPHALTDARKAIEKFPSFSKRHGHWVCNADRLSLDVITVAEWLCKKVEICDEPARIKALLTWMFDGTDIFSGAERDLADL